MMDLTPERWQHLDSLLDEALARPPDERTAFLRASCGHDRALYEDALGLLARFGEAEHALGESVAPLAARLYEGEAGQADADDALAPSTPVGAYRIVREVGRGGMGAVYLAARADGLFEKAVALKLVKRGMDTDEVLRRFGRERRILAGLDHPGIARLLDAGAAPDGRPFLVMEYVEGEPLTAYADRHRLDAEARLALFEGVGEAVAYAHRRLVVHRDLKPSNVLVAEDEHGQAHVKLLDFGIARLLDAEADERVTRTGVRPFTPAYAAPEQRRGEAVTTAADVYALGVMLCELLTGARPQVGASREGQARGESASVRPPSVLVTEAAAEARATTAEKLRRRLRGDLDLITLKALREEPEARYGSVEALLDDLRRHRAGLPVRARPASARYQLRKFVRRHRIGVGASAAFVGLLVAATVALALQQQQTARERDRAEAAAQQSREATRFLASLFEEANPADTGGDTLSALQVLDRGAARLDEELAAEPELHARLLFIFGDVYARMGRHEVALGFCERALMLERRLYGEQHPEVASALFCLASAHYSLGRRILADSLFDAYAAMMAVLPEEVSPEHAQRLNFMGGLLFSRGALDHALAYHRRAHAIYRQLYGLVDERSIYSGIEIALTLNEQGAPDEAEAWLHGLLGALDRLPDAVGEKQRLRALVIHATGDVNRAQGHLEEADAAYGEALALMRRLKPTGAILANWLMQYGGLLVEQGRLAEAETAYRDAREGFGREYGEGSFYAMHVQRLLGDVVRDRGAFAAAEPLLREAYARLREERGTEDSFTQGAVRSLVTLYEAWGRPVEAARYRAMLVADAPAPAGH